MNKLKTIKAVVLFCVILILALGIVYGGLRILESTLFNNDKQGSIDNSVTGSAGEEDSEENSGASVNDEQPANNNTTSSKTIVKNGVSYFPRQDITVILVMGIDQSGPVKSSGYFRNEGSADMVSLIIFDEKNEECRVLYLNRDTMLTMPAIGLGGKQAGTFYGQLALSHTYGSGLEDSCENVKTAVSDFLHGINIDYYMSMNMDAISVLNDAVGGVTVTVVDDFSSIDPTITMGEVTLKGEQALTYIRSRKYLGDQMNITRLERQKGYINAFIDAFRGKQSAGVDFVLTTYEEVAQYLVSDCPVTSFNSMLNRYKDYPVIEIVTPEGENVLGDEYYEFYADEEALDDLILRLFYAPK